MGDWHEVEHKVTGERQHVADLDRYPASKWRRTRLDREPAHGERHKGGGKLAVDAEEVDRIAARARWLAMDPAERMQRLEKLESAVYGLERRLAALEPAPQAKGK